MTRDELLQDLAYARTLAEEGQRAPLIGGAYLVLFGALLAICYSAQWAAITGAIRGEFIGMIWIGFGIVAVIGTFALRGRTRSLPGGTSIANRADRVIWQGVVAAILAVVAGSLVRGIVFDDFRAPNAIMAAGFGLYGVALFATSNLGGQAWLKPFAVLAWLVSTALWFFLDQPWAYLLAAAASVVVLLIPGVVMMRREPSTIV